jgi:CTP:molybdopterin cytidylyltransferase MocA
MRFGAPKQRVLLEPVLARVRASSVDDIVVVLGAHPVETTARILLCPDWARGPGASLRCGLGGLGPRTEAAVVVLADGPDLAPAAIDRVVAAWRGSQAEVVAATYEGNRGHPVLLARSAWGRVPDEGARTLDALEVPCDDLGAPGDVDVISDLPSRFEPGAAEDHRVDEDEPRGAALPASEAGGAANRDGGEGGEPG